MPELGFRVSGVEAAARGLAPLLHFKLELTNSPPDEPIHGVTLHAQIQIEAPRRPYSASEKAKLVELFGEPERWGQTLRNRLWAHADVSIQGFTGRTETILPVPCTYDLNQATTKFFHALENGDVPLLFLFSGSVFYAAADGALQVARISWEKECEFQMPAKTWHALMQQHYPNSAWLTLHRDVFERLAAYKRRHGLATWEMTIDRLLQNGELRSEREPERKLEQRSQRTIEEAAR